MNFNHSLQFNQNLIIYINITIKTNNDLNLRNILLINHPIYTEYQNLS